MDNHNKSLADQIEELRHAVVQLQERRPKYFRKFVPLPNLKDLKLETGSKVWEQEIAPGTFPDNTTALIVVIEYMAGRQSGNIGVDIVLNQEGADVESQALANHVFSIGHNEKFLPWDPKLPQRVSFRITNNAFLIYWDGSISVNIVGYTTF